MSMILTVKYQVNVIRFEIKCFPSDLLSVYVCVTPNRWRGIDERSLEYQGCTSRTQATRSSEGWTSPHAAYPDVGTMVQSHGIFPFSHKSGNSNWTLWVLNKTDDILQTAFSKETKFLNMYCIRNLLKCVPESLIDEKSQFTSSSKACLTTCLS